MRRANRWSGLLAIQLWSRGQRAHEKCLHAIFSARTSCCAIMLALVVYLLSKNVKRSLCVRPSAREAVAWLMSVQRGFAVEPKIKRCAGSEI